MALLLIRAELVNPPSDHLSFRDVTLYSTVQLHFDVVVETADDARDIYYTWMKKKGLLDFVKDVLTFGEETGLRLDYRVRTYDTIKVERIVPENLATILKMIKATI